MALFPGLPGWAGTRRDIHPLTPILISNIVYQLPPSTTIHSILFVQFMCLTVLFHNLSPFPLWSSFSTGTLYFILHNPYISSPKHHLFATHAHPITTCFAVVPKLCRLFLISLAEYLEICCWKSVSDFLQCWNAVFCVAGRAFNMWKPAVASLWAISSLLKLGGTLWWDIYAYSCCVVGQRVLFRTSVKN